MRKLSWGKRACAVVLLCAATAVALGAQDSPPIFTTLHTFESTDGGDPQGTLVQATDGNLYGTTYHGGANDWGAVFKITPSGTFTELYSFCPQSGCADDYQPLAGLIQATDGNLYGTTFGGGTGTGPAGTIFKITLDGARTTVFNFFCQVTNCTDGVGPSQALVEGADGSFYGTTPYDSKFSYGTVYKVTPGSKLTTLYTFCPGRRSCTDGATPYTSLVQAADGSFYGTTYGGGTGGGGNGRGTIFKITPGGNLTSLYSFCSQSNCADGVKPYGGLVQAADGNLYGTTSGGGANIGHCYATSGCGTIFKITPSGTLTTLYNFCPQEGCLDGFEAAAPLVQATDGNFYGVTSYGGVHESGTVFRMTPAGKLTTLYDFCSQSNCTDGSAPVTIAQATGGNFYGTTVYGGDTNACLVGYGCGTVFGLSVGLSPFVETQPGFGKVGAAVKILGTDLTGATSVSFNGTATGFQVASSSLITAVVPAGATSGKVQVVTPSGTLSSNVSFRVQQ